MAVFILSQSFNVHLIDVMKLQNLMEHIAFHEATYGDDIFSFISKHYGLEMAEHNQQKENSEEHQQLPFNHGVLLDAGHLFVCEVFVESLDLSVAPDAQERDFFYYNFYSFLGNSDIFQPPRIG